MMHKVFKSYLVALGVMTAYCFAHMFIRNAVEGNTTYNFLIWNLFLAFVPLAAAWLAFFAVRWSKVVTYVLTAVWLFFYPNAPYMVSDMIHVNATSSMVLYDALMLFMFAMLALFYGFCSLKVMHYVFRKYVGVKTAQALITFSILLSAAGIYLGRILRLNSWDLVTQPIATLKTIFNHLWPVDKNPTTYVIIVLFSAVQFMLLMMMRDMDDMKESADGNERSGRLRLLGRRKPIGNEQ